MKNLLSRKNISLTLLGTITSFNIFAEEGLNHTDIMGCYASVFIQCPVGDQGCLDWGYDNCDGSYNNSILEINSFELVTRKGTVKLTPSQKTQAMKIKKSVRMRR